MTFSIREAIGMHYVAEFVESPLFTRWEQEQLYGIMHREKHANAPADLGRFLVSVVSSDNGQWQSIAFDFAPKAAG